MKPFFFLAACVVGIGLIGAQAPRLDEQIHPQHLNENLDVAEDHAGASLLGQFRTSLSSWLWVRTDLYLHNGVQMRPMTDGELRQGIKASSSADGLDEDQGKFTETTIIPPAERDFRGIFGDVERTMSAYQDMAHHQHQAPEQTLPLYRLMTWLDPTFEEGWATGAHVMALDTRHKGVDVAVQFVHQGLGANPNSILLWNDLGFLQARKAGDLYAAIQALEKGREAIAKRSNLGDKDLETAQSLYRWLTICYRDTGQYGAAVRTAREGLQRFKKDVVLEHNAQIPPAVSLSLPNYLAAPADAPKPPVEDGERTAHEDHNGH